MAKSNVISINDTMTIIMVMNETASVDFVLICFKIYQRKFF